MQNKKRTMALILSQLFISLILSLFFSLTLLPHATTSKANSSSEYSITSIFNVTAANHKTSQILSFKPFHNQEEFPQTFSSSSSFKLKLYPAASLYNTHHQHKNYYSLELNASLNPGITTGTSNFLVQIGVGGPPQKFYMIFDLQTDFTWLQCQPCIKCYDQPDSIFDPSQSSSYTLLSCETKHCNLLPNSSCSDDGYCRYNITYKDGTNTEGVLINETVSFESSGWVDRVSLGCSNKNQGPFVGSDGTFGLGRGSLSFPSRINATSMSYCLVESKDGYSSSTLEFNSPPCSGSVKAKLLQNPKAENLYYVGLKGIKVGGEKIDVPNSTFTIDPYGNGGMIVSSSSLITMLENDTYNVVRDAFVAKTQHLERLKAFLQFDTCYNLSSNNTVELPIVEFEVNDGKSWLLPKESYLYAVDKNGTFCFAFAPSKGSFSILGTLQQYGTRVTFDLVNSFVYLHTLCCN